MVPVRISQLLSREQRAFLARPREAWAPHLAAAQAFLGEALEGAPPDRPVLVLGAGAGLEVPWARAPRTAVGWDADPWSRVRTALRHHCWPAWVFEDVTGGFAELLRTAHRAQGHPWSGRRRAPEQAVARLAGLLPSLDPVPRALEAWVAQHRPGRIVAANVLGQLAPLARRAVGQAFAPYDPWDEDPERRDPLAEAAEAWVARALGRLLAVFAAAGCELWSLHDRGVLYGDPEVALGPVAEPWIAQLRASVPLEAEDAWCGVDPVRLLAPARVDRWLWPLGPGQLHVMEALVSGSPAPRPGP